MPYDEDRRDWQVIQTTVFKLRETEGFSRGKPRVENEFTIHVESYRGRSVADVKLLAQGIADLLNAYEKAKSP